MANTILLGLFFSSTLAFAGCAASAPPAADAAPHGEHEGEHHGDHHGEHEGEHHEGAMPATLQAYHDVLAPIWHSEPGAVRVGKTCDGQAALATGAAAVVAGEVPPAAQADAEGWKATATKMKADIDGLAEACAAELRPDVEARLGTSHDGFHELLDRSKGKR